MADFWGGLAQGFAPAYESALARREREAKEEKADKARAAAIKLAAEQRKEMTRRWDVEQKAKKDALALAASQRQEGFDREDAQLRIKRAQAVQDREDAERRGDIKEAEKADAAIQSFDEEIQKKVQPKAPPLLSGDLSGLPVPVEFEGSPGMMEGIRESLAGEKGEIPLGNRLAMAAKGARLQKIKDDIAKEKRTDAASIRLKGAVPGAAPKEPPTSVEERRNTRLLKIAKDYPAADAKGKSDLERQAQVLLSEGREQFMPMDKVREWIKTGEPGAAEGEGLPKETATEKEERTKRLAMLKSMDELLLTAKEKDWTGLVPGLESEFFDKLLPKAGLDKYANIARLQFRNTLGPTAYSIAREMLQEARMTDKDWIFLKDFTPLPTDEKPEVVAKLQAVSDLVRAKLSIADKRAGRHDLFQLEPSDFFNQMDQPNEKFGGAITVPSEIAPAVIRHAPQFQYVGGDKSKPISAADIIKMVKDKVITEKQGMMWLKNAPGVFQRK